MKDCSIQLTNHPGDFARVAQALGRRGVNLDAFYITGITNDLVELAIVSDNPKKAKKILEEF